MSDSNGLPRSDSSIIDQEYKGELPNEKNWIDFAKNRYHDCEGMFGYIDATKEITESIQSLLDSSPEQTMEEFRGALISFCSQRNALVNHFKSIPSPGDAWY